MENIKNKKEKDLNLQIVNLTPHCVSIIRDGFETIDLQSVGNIRLSQSTENVGMLGNITLSKTTFGSTDLPEENPKKILIVSSLVCRAFPQRKDLYIPNEIIRDKNGGIIGCRSLAKNPFASDKLFFVFPEDNYLCGFYNNEEEVKKLIETNNNIKGSLMQYDYITL